MNVSRFVLISGALIPMLAGCATTAQKAEIQQLQNKVVSLESQLKQQQGDNEQLKDQLTKACAAKKEVVRMPNGKEIQTALKNAGYYEGTIDGQIGSVTKEAIKKFQSANGLTPDGVIGSRTWQLLSKHLDSAS